MQTPYQAPDVQTAPADDLLDTYPAIPRFDIYGIAKAQRGLMLCILIQMIIFLLLVGVTLTEKQINPYVSAEKISLGINISIGLIGLIAIIYAFKLATKVYSVGLGILFGLMAMVPLFGFFMMVLLNVRASTILTLSGIKVGLLGARIKDHT